MSVWSTESGLLRYGWERFPLKLFAPVILFLAVPSLLSVGETPRLAALALLFALVFQFRLWDDLGDLKSDRVEFPERVLSRASSLAPFLRLWLAAAAGIVLLLSGHRHLLWIYLATVMWFLVWYGWLADRSPPAIRYHVVALKYPLFVYLAAGLSSASRGHLLLATTALVYFTFVVYEPLHDPRLHRLPGIDAVLASGLAMWSATAVLTSMMARGGTAPASLLLLVALGALALALASYRRFRREADCTFFGRGVFLFALAAVLGAHGGEAWA